MKIYLPTKEIFTSDYQAYIFYRKLSNGKAEPIDSIDWEKWNIFPFMYAQYDTLHKQTSELIIENGTYTFKVIPIDETELSNINIARIRSIQNGRRSLILEEIDPDGMILINESANLGHPKAIANKEWIKMTAYEMLHRVALVENNQWDKSLADWTQYPKKPYLIEEIIYEMGGL